MLTKAGIRQTLRETLRLLSPESKARASAAIRQQLTALPAFQTASVVAIFYPTATEPDLLPLLADAGKTFLFPCCHSDRSLSWHAATVDGPWKTSRFGITEPDPAHLPAAPAEHMDLVIVPGLAFTLTGDRLGHGAGYYDRFLATLPDTTSIIGICFESQILPHLPREAHDIPIPQIIHA